MRGPGSGLVGIVCSLCDVPCALPHAPYPPTCFLSYGPLMCSSHVLLSCVPCQGLKTNIMAAIKHDKMHKKAVKIGQAPGVMIRGGADLDLLQGRASPPPPGWQTLHRGGYPRAAERVPGRGPGP